jgi:hypothetical protein
VCSSDLALLHFLDRTANGAVHTQPSPRAAHALSNSISAALGNLTQADVEQLVIPHTPLKWVDADTFLRQTGASATRLQRNDSGAANRIHPVAVAFSK